MFKALLRYLGIRPAFDPIDAAISEGVQAGLDARGTVTPPRHATPVSDEFYRQETGGDDDASGEKLTSS